MVGFLGFLIVGAILTGSPTRDPEALFNWKMMPLWSGVTLFMVSSFYVPVTSTILRVFISVSWWCYSRICHITDHHVRRMSHSLKMTIFLEQ